MVAAASHISPLRYPGGKSRIWEHLAAQYAQAPLGELDVEIWFEPFAGGLGAGHPAGFRMSKPAYPGPRGGRGRDTNQHTTSDPHPFPCTLEP